MTESQVEKGRGHHSRQSGERARLNPETIKKSKKNSVNNLKPPGKRDYPKKEREIIFQSLNKLTPAMIGWQG